MQFSKLTPEQWRDFLLMRLRERWQLGILSPSGRHRSTPWREISDYYEGHHPLQFATPKFAEAFGDLFKEFADNWCDIVVDAPVERLDVQGFRFGATSDADNEAWSIWRANGLDGAARQVHQAAIELGEAYWLVDPSPQDGGMPQITAEHPAQTIVFCDPADQRRRLAALKTWVVSAGRGVATLWLPDRIYRWECPPVNVGYNSSLLLPPGAESAGGWASRKDAEAVEENKLGVVPVVPLPNKPGMLVAGRSDLEKVLGLQAAINKLCSDILVGSEFTAWPQRILTGVAQPKDPETGQPIAKAQLEAGVSRLLLFNSAQAKTAEWAAADPSRLVQLVEMFVQHLSAQSKTPPHYLLGKMVNVSGEALVAAEAGLVSRTKAKMPHFGEGHTEMMRLAFLAKGDKDRAERHEAETIWGDPAIQSEAERFDAAVKGMAIGLPRRLVWERLGMSPTEIARAEAEVAADALLNPDVADQAQAGATAIVAAKAAAQQAAGQPSAVASSGAKIPGARPSLPGTLAEPDPMIHVAPLTVRA